ncbi:TRAP transporter large permease [Desulfonatronovibrio hydrogenovorans]|uniref:TRAP transporter large permease n=1 Tax=Desulfonatronovibrio hydrogenovorans TaxID=53245 RepID=UPI00048AF0CE|nr:TRAP transporter large permease [Desulfonatronovibrio hydrogenovorans]
MSLTLVGITGIISLLLIIFFLRIPVGFAMAMVGFAGFAWVVNPQAAMGMLADEVWEVFSSYGLTVIPMFILMGQISFHAGVNKRLYNAAYVWMGRVRGGMAMSTILACAGFAAICGSNTATAATMGTVALPEMKKYGYSPVLSSASVAAGATLGVLIPPSVVLIVIGLQTGQAIGVLFWAALLPGFLLCLFFLGSIYLLCLRHPGVAPAGTRTTLREKVRALKGAVEILILFALIMVGMIKGFFTPTQAGAIGSFLALTIGVIGGNLGFRKIYLALTDTLRISAMIMAIILGAVIFGRFLAVTRLPFELATIVGELAVPSFVIIILIGLVYILGGAIMDALALLIITIPIFFPIAQSMGYDPVWFAVFITVVTTLGAITPPVGINTYIVASMGHGASLSGVFRGVMLFIPCFFLLLFLLILFPGIAVYLPGLFY